MRVALHLQLGSYWVLQLSGKVPESLFSLYFWVAVDLEREVSFALSLEMCFASKELFHIANEVPKGQNAKKKLNVLSLPYILILVLLHQLVWLSEASKDHSYLTW